MPNSIFQTMSFKDVPNTFVSRSRYEREKAARETAENLLEKKSYELYSANKKLKEMAMYFEAIAEEKTKELLQALEKTELALEISQLAEVRLSISESKFRSFVENANDIVFTLNTDGIFDYLSPRLTEVLGYQDKDLLGKHFSTVIHPEDLASCAEFFKRLITSLKPEAGLEYRVRHADGSWHWHDTNAAPLFDKNENISGMLGIGRDIHQRKQDEKILFQLANFDMLTGLANRSSILARLERELEQAKTDNTSLAVMFLDLNNFKEINDTHGHAAGDKVLRTIAERLQLSVRNYTDAVGRLAGDEFLIILPNIKDRNTAEKVAQRIKKCLSDAIKISETHILVGCSVGVSLYPGDADDVDALVSHADTAMYQHKASRLGDAVFYKFPMR